MPELRLEPPLIHMPRFGDGVWLNTPTPLTRAAVRGRVVLVDFWDYTCVNCIRTLPYLKAWHTRYHDRGLTIIGVHTPEFQFARGEGLVAEAVADFALPYPVLLDNEYATWDRFANHAWPTKHLVDARGYIRLRHQGEGRYDAFEQAVQALLREHDPSVSLPGLLPPLRQEDAPGAVCYRPTPELYAGYRGGGLYGGALGNREGYVTGGAVVAYSLPPPAEREERHFYLDGFWKTEPEAVVFAGQAAGRVLIPYRAAGVNAVLSPSSDPVDLILGLRPSKMEPLVEVLQDGRPLARGVAGADVHFDREGRSLVRVTQARMYHLVQNPSFSLHRLDLIFHASRMALFAVTFTSCVAPPGEAGSAATFTFSSR